MKKKIFIYVIAALLIFAGYFVYLKIKELKDPEKVPNVSIKYNKGKKYLIYDGDYNGEYEILQPRFHIEHSGTEDYEEKMNKMIQEYNTEHLLSYDEYSEFCNKWDIHKKYSDKNKKYMVIAEAMSSGANVDVKIANVVEKDGKITVYMLRKFSGDFAGPTAYLVVIPVDKNVVGSDVIDLYSKEDYKNIVIYGTPYNPNGVSWDKPIIYIYPQEETRVNVKLLNSKALTTSYPKYEDGWNVIATSDGNLKDLKTNRNYYGLYYEGNNNNVSMKDDGFIVEGEKTSEFLEEKLEILGLNEREINEFIIYWLPILDKNKYNYIRFETKEEIESYMPLEITPSPDSIIRVIMDYKPLNKKVKITEQELTPQERHGYSVIEWGGCEIK